MMKNRENGERALRALTETRESIEEFMARGGKVTKCAPRKLAGAATFGHMRIKAKGNAKERAARAEAKMEVLLSA